LDALSAGSFEEVAGFEREQGALDRLFFLAQFGVDDTEFLA